ncbi:hypothetical protein ACFYYH_08795 [Streptomyces sp. NPDC002018]|uniref:hypothetical protein n=1 Tax=Streptomyces sp. NPDC002018 TaxID=3364629 RepID=UPI0036C089FD
MNPHDAANRPGAHLVAEEFGVEDPWALSNNRPLSDPLGLVGQAGRMVVEAARDVDELHGELTRAAQSAVALLEPVGRGEFGGTRVADALLRTAVPQIGQLIARRGTAHERLAQSISTYRRLLPEPNAVQPSKAPVHGPNKEQDSGRDDDWAISGDRRLGALEAVEAGGLRFHQSGVHGYIYLSDGRGPRPIPEVWPETVQRLVADGLLNQDTSEALYRPGQLLSLTPQGEAAPSRRTDGHAAHVRRPQPQQHRGDLRRHRRSGCRTRNQRGHQAFPFPLISPQEGTSPMSTVIYARRLVEHRYGRPLEDLRRGNASGHFYDPVLPVLLRRLGGLTRTDTEARSARHDLDAAWQRYRTAEHGLDDLVLRYATRLADLERQEASQAEALWDLLDVRLLLEQSTYHPASARRTHTAPDTDELMAAARQVAARLPRLNRDTLRQALHDHGIHASNRRLGAVLHRLRTERTHL